MNDTIRDEATADRSTRNQLALSRTSIGTTIAPTNFNDIVEFAKDMSRAESAIPKHLRGNVGACMAVAMQAIEWNMSPFAVANKSYVVSDRLAYEAQLIAAVVNTRSGIKGRLKYKYAGEGPNLRCTVIGIIGSDTLEYTSPKISDITTKNSPMWRYDPEQQLGYYSARAWARRHVPEVLLGVYDREELEVQPDPIDVTPPSPTVEAEAERITHDKPKKAPAKKKAAPAKVEEPEEEQEEDDNPPSVSSNPEIEHDNTYAPYATFGDYLEGMEEGFKRCKDEEDIEIIWSEFDPMATLEGDEDGQEAANKLKQRYLLRL